MFQHSCMTEQNLICYFKKIASYFVNPLLVTFQQSLYQGVFLERWKRANVIPLNKGKGERSNVSSYRPISLCSCFGKLLEKEQVQKHQHRLRLLMTSNFWQRQMNKVLLWHSMLLILLVIGLLIIPCL